jgi:hypothetical protein
MDQRVLAVLAGYDLDDVPTYLPHAAVVQPQAGRAPAREAGLLDE